MANEMPTNALICFYDFPNDSCFYMSILVRVPLAYLSVVWRPFNHHSRRHQWRRRGWSRWRTHGGASASSGAQNTANTLDDVLEFLGFVMYFVSGFSLFPNGYLRLQDILKHIVFDIFGTSKT